MTIVLERDGSGREILWQCSECGKPFNLGWGSKCNACIAQEKRHAQLIRTIRAVSVSIVDKPVDPHCKTSDGEYLTIDWEETI
jgi:hypothetical protein